MSVLSSSFTSRTQQYSLWVTSWCQQEVVHLHGFLGGKVHRTGLRRTNGAALCLSWTVSNCGQVDRNVNLHCVIVWIYFTQWGFTAVVFNVWSFLPHTPITTDFLSFKKVLNWPKRYDQPTLRSTNTSHSGPCPLIANTVQTAGGFQSIGGVVGLAMHETKFKKITFYWGPTDSQISVTWVLN